MSESHEPGEATSPGELPSDVLDAYLAAAGYEPDSQASLAAGGTSVLKAFETSVCPMPRVQLRDAAKEPITPVLKLKPSGTPAGAEGGPEASGRYQIFGEIARGGMGVVLKGRDTDLGRELAMKVLLRAHREAGAPGALRRGGADRGAAPAPGDRAGVRAGAARGPAAVLHHEAREGEDARGAPRGAEGPRGGAAEVPGDLPAGGTP